MHTGHHMLSSGRCGPETAELRRPTRGPTWFSRTAECSLWDFEGGGSRWLSLVVMSWALRPVPGCCWLECVILPLTSHICPSIAAALQTFTMVLTHRHSDCNRMLSGRGPRMSSACPTILGSCPWLPLPSLFLRPNAWEVVGEVQRWVEVDAGSGRGM